MGNSLTPFLLSFSPFPSVINQLLHHINSAGLACTSFSVPLFSCKVSSPPSLSGCLATLTLSFLKVVKLPYQLPLISFLCLLPVPTTAAWTVLARGARPPWHQRLKTEEEGLKNHTLIPVPFSTLSFHQEPKNYLGINQISLN